MKITLKSDDNLLALSERVGTPIEDLVRHVIHQVVEADAIDLDDYDYAGQTVVSLFDAVGHSPTTATLFCLGKCTPDILNLFSKIRTWGITDKAECPECGSEAEYHDGDVRTDHGDGYTSPPEHTVVWAEYKCTNTNCNHIFEYHEN